VLGLGQPNMYQKILTAENIKTLEKFPFGSQEKVENPKILVKFFTPWSNWTWFVTEAEKQEDGDWLFFGMVHGFEQEMGYFALSELTSVRGIGGLKIERDINFEGNLSDIM
jgi:hypothetical protein